MVSTVQIKISGKDVELPEDLYRNYCILVGNRAYEKMKEFISLPKFNRLPKTYKKKWLKGIFDRIRREERTKIKVRLMNRKRPTGG